MNIVFHIDLPAKDISEFISGLIIIILAAVVICKIKSGSQNTFAYSLMSFSLLLGLGLFGIALVESIVNEV